MHKKGKAKKQIEKTKPNNNIQESSTEDDDSQQFKEKGKKIQLFSEQLEELGKEIFEVKGDGNCLFRSFADQMEKNQNKHGYYRGEACKYMKENYNYFTNYVEDDNSLKQYIKEMESYGSWGGNQELYALSMRFNVNIYIYSYNEPIKIIHNFDNPDKTVHVSYHDESHYNSVRSIPDIKQNQETTSSDIVEEKQEKGRSLFGIIIKDIKQKKETVETNPSILTGRGLVIEMETFNFKKCHCGSHKKYSNCCQSVDLIGEFDKGGNVFYYNAETESKKLEDNLNIIYI